MRIVVVCISFLLLHFSAYAEDQWEREELEPIVRNVHTEPGITADELFTRLNQYLQYAQQQDWQDIELIAAVQLAFVHRAIGQYDEALVLTDKYLPIAESKNDVTALHLLNIRLDVFDGYHDEDRAKLAREEFKTKTLAFSDPGETAFMYVQVAQSYQVFDDLSEALLYTQKSLTIFDELNELEGLTHAQNSLTDIHHALGNYDKSIEYGESVLAYLREYGDISSLATLYFKVGNSYFQIGDLAKAKDYLSRSEAFSTQLNDKLGMASAYHRLARISVKEEDFDSALAGFSKALTLFQIIGNERMTLSVSLDLAELQIQMDMIEDALTLLAPLGNSAALETQRELTLHYYELLFEVENKRQNYPAAIAALETLHSITKAEFEKERTDSIREMIIKFEADKTAANNKLLENQNEIRQLRLQRQEAENTILFLGFGIAIFTIVVISLFLLRQLRKQNRLKIMALRDELTGAPNRRAIMVQARECLKRYKKNGANYVLIIIDIDYFKRVNDNYGHDVGDQVLIAFSKACSSSIRSHDFYGRLGGEEWLLVLKDVTEQHVHQLFMRIRQYLRDSHVEGVPSDAQLTFSMGAVQLNDNYQELHDFMKKADENLYAAKENGRDQFKFSD